MNEPGHASRALMIVRPTHRMAEEAIRMTNPTTASETPLLSPAAVHKLVRSPALDTVRQLLRWTGKEVLWTTDLFLRLTASVLVIRAITQLTGHWLFPRQTWESSEQLLAGFRGKAEPPPDPSEKPRLVLTHADWRFYEHQRVYPQQFFPCPLLVVEPCSTCTWYVRGTDGRPYCAAVAKVRTRLHDRYKDMDLYDLRDELRAVYANRSASVNV